MLKQHMAACLLVTALAAPAFAQTTQSGAGGDRPAATGSGSATSGSPSMRPGSSTESGTAPLSTSSSSTAPTIDTTAGSSATSTASSTPSGASGQFITQQQPDQLMASKLIGTTVVGQNNDSIGDVNDVLMDRTGKAVGVVVGVGGFLGIGEKDVAVPFDQLEFTTASATAPSTGATGSAATSTSGNPATTGTTSSTSNGTAASRSATPDRVVLKMTREQLQNAPRFAAYGRSSESSSTTGSTGGGATGTGTTTTGAPARP